MSTWGRSRTRCTTGDEPPGDPYREVTFEPHALWRVEGRDLHLTLPVAPREAELGAEVELPTPDGPVATNLPAGSRSGCRLRLRGRGLPGREPGERCVLLGFVSPPAPGDKARGAWRAMARDLAFDLRRRSGADA